MEEANSKVQEAVNKHINDIDKSCLRKLQVKMFKCSAQCCENNQMSMHQVQECVTRCNAPAQQADQYLQTELQSFQSRLQRCVLDCRDKSNDMLGSSASEKDRQQATVLLEKCAVKCVDTHLALLPNLFKRIKDTLESSK